MRILPVSLFQAGNILEAESPVPKEKNPGPEWFVEQITENITTSHQYFPEENVLQIDSREI